MIIAVDETGCFSESGTLKYGLVTLVTVTDKEWVKFSGFMDNLYPKGWSKIKGTNITFENRQKILKYIGKKQEIKYTCFLYDLTPGTDEWVKWHKNEQVKRIEKSITSVKKQSGHPNLIRELELIRNQIRNLSVSDYSKFIMIFELFVQWQRFFQFDYVYTYHKNDSWRMRHIIDTQNKPDKFKWLVKNMLSLTTSERNPNYGIYSPKEWLNGHPFNEIYGMKEDINKINAKLFYENFKIGNELQDLELLLPDLIGNTIHKSIQNRKIKQWLKLVKRLTSNRSLTITNKVTGNNHQYYLIRGFDKLRPKKAVNPILREHCLLLAKL